MVKMLTAPAKTSSVPSTRIPCSHLVLTPTPGTQCPLLTSGTTACTSTNPHPHTHTIFFFNLKQRYGDCGLKPMRAFTCLTRIYRNYSLKKMLITTRSYLGWERDDEVLRVRSADGGAELSYLTIW